MATSPQQYVLVYILHCLHDRFSNLKNSTIEGMGEIKANYNKS